MTEGRCQCWRPQWARSPVLLEEPGPLSCVGVQHPHPEPRSLHWILSHSSKSSSLCSSPAPRTQANLTWVSGQLSQPQERISTGTLVSPLASTHGGLAGWGC